jgi:hypothetical protein
MAAEIQPKPLTRKPILLQRVEGSQEVVNMAVIVPKEEGVISVSEDRYGREEGRTGRRSPSVRRGLCPHGRECRRAPPSFVVTRILGLSVSSSAPPTPGSEKRAPWAAHRALRPRPRPGGARGAGVALGLTVRGTLDRGPAGGGERGREEPPARALQVCALGGCSQPPLQGN